MQQMGTADGSTEPDKRAGQHSAGPCPPARWQAGPCSKVVALCRYAFFNLRWSGSCTLWILVMAATSAALVLHPCSASRQGQGVSGALCAVGNQQAASQLALPIKGCEIDRCC